MKATSAGWRLQSGVWEGGGGRWDEGYISRLETAFWGWGEEGGMKAISAGWRPCLGLGGGRWDEGYISRLESAVWGWGEEGGMKAISAGWSPQSGAGGRKVG
ncbi:hypothetical protein RRG08_053721 [Elysia crispata]|uniref:Uncharacterized protein n=1 Tax=Elysia crispata TaxID=231223 RepID=A0AAE0XYI9_9GAST|nr:hypothetical protein RRG08_053721 [Elysia crispata]